MTNVTREFAPRPSNGHYWEGAIGFSAVLLFIVPVFIAVFEMSTVGVMILAVSLLVLGLLVSGPILVVTWYAPSMRNVLTEEALVLKCGPLMSDRIRLNEIKSVRMHEHLKVSMLASFRFPGLALFDVDYTDMNRARMCATTASKRILLIETGKRRYGINPEDEAGFLNVLKQRLEEPAVIVTSPETALASEVEATR
jgi:hypothetical protein